MGARSWETRRGGGDDAFMTTAMSVLYSLPTSGAVCSLAKPPAEARLPCTAGHEFSIQQDKTMYHTTSAHRHLFAIPLPVLAACILAGASIAYPNHRSNVLTNDDCNSPLSISGDGQFPYDNSNATTGSEGQSNSACLFFGTMAIGNDIWYTWTPLASGYASLSFCGGTTMDTKVAVYAGAGCPSAAPIVCNEHGCVVQSVLCFSVTAGNQYTIQIGNYPTTTPGTGTFTLIVSTPASGSCDAIDDGSSETAVALTAGGSVCWIQRFGTVGQSTTVTSISTAWGSPLDAPSQNPPNGTAADILIWSDPNQDSNPTDGVLLQHVTGVVAGSGTDQFTTFGLNPPVTVNGYFFVGASVSAPNGVYPAPLDQDINCIAAGATWVAGNTTGPMNFSSLASNNVPPLELQTGAGIVGQWLLRVTCAGSNPGFDLCVPGVAGVMACPCANPQVPANSTRGCNNSANTGGAQLTSSGTASLTGDTLTFTSAGEKPTATSILLQGRIPASSSGVQFGQGVRCITVALKRLYVHGAMAGSVTFPQGADPLIHDKSAAEGDTITAGSTRLYAVYYRDPVVLGGCPSGDTFNSTQTQSVLWGP
jgi:hypothetical protein